MPISRLIPLLLIFTLLGGCIQESETNPGLYSTQFSAQYTSLDGEITITKLKPNWNLGPIADDWEQIIIFEIDAKPVHASVWSCNGPILAWINSGDYWQLGPDSFEFPSRAFAPQLITSQPERIEFEDHSKIDIAWSSDSRAVYEEYPPLANNPLQIWTVEWNSDSIPQKILGNLNLELVDFESISTAPCIDSRTNLLPTITLGPLGPDAFPKTPHSWESIQEFLNGPLAPVDYKIWRANNPDGIPYEIELMNSAQGYEWKFNFVGTPNLYVNCLIGEVATSNMYQCSATNQFGPSYTVSINGLSDFSFLDLVVDQYIPESMRWTLNFTSENPSYIIAEGTRANDGAIIYGTRGLIFDPIRQEIVRLSSSEKQPWVLN